MLVPGSRAARRWRGDAVAILLLIALPVLVYGVPALLGHPVLPGDDLTQNFPLRVLAGHEIRGGHLPLYDPYIWSGAPLLAGWNAGAAYPFTFLFAVAPPVAAWTLNMILTWAVAGTGMFAFLRGCRLGRVPGLLGALSFAFAGAMSAQVAHFGLVAGVSWVPVQLLCVLRLTGPRTMASRLAWTAALAGTFGLTILAGEPRAIDDAGLVIAIYAVWQIARLGRRWGPAALSVAGGLALGACLGAIQWLPGLAVVATSQRGASSVALFNSGSLPHRWLLLMLVPDLLGGSGSFGQPAFFANYNLAEVTGYVGILPLVAALALLGRVRLRPRPPEWLVWHVLALAGIVLALGGNTPVGDLLAHVPLFGGQRLQSRNILIADLALAVLLAYWASHPLSEGSRRFLRIRGRRGPDLETVLALLPPLAVVAVAALGLCWGAGLLHWLRAGPAADSLAGLLKPWLVPYALLGAGAIALVIGGRRLRPGPRSRWLAGFVLADLIVFTLLGVVAVGSGPAGHGTSAASSPAPAAPAAPAAATRAAVPAAAAPAAAVRPVAALGYPGRFAIYDPDQLDAHSLSLLGAPDLNVISGTPSVQGYSSLVSGFYASATGSHQAAGEGQDVLDPRAVRDGVLDQLDTSVLLTLPAYLATAAGGSVASSGPPGTGQRDLAPRHQATWYFAAPLSVTRLEVPDADARQDAAAGTEIGLLTTRGATRWFPAAAAGARRLAITLPRPLTSVAVVAQAGGRAARLGPASVASTGGRVFVADGQLQDALIPPRWGYAGHDGPFAVFVDHFARGPLGLQALPGRSTSGASVRAVAGPAGSPAVADVSSPHGVRVIRSVAATAGWTATWRPRRGAPAALAVHRDGLVQAVDVPAGRGIVIWSYRPPGFRMGFALSFGATTLIIALLIAGLFLSRAGRPGEPAWDPPGPDRIAEPMVRNGLPDVQPVFSFPSYGEARNRASSDGTGRPGRAGEGPRADQGGWDGAGERHDLVQGSGLPARPGRTRLRDLARGRAAGAASGAVAGDAGRVGRGVVPVQRGRGARHHRPSPVTGRNRAGRNRPGRPGLARHARCLARRPFRLAGRPPGLGGRPLGRRTHRGPPAGHRRRPRAGRPLPGLPVGVEPGPGAG
jgi:hypothetical protein